MAGLFAFVIWGAAFAAEVQVPAGVYAPFFRDEGEADQAVAALSIDRDAVTNSEFLAFVRTHPDWRKSRIKTLYAGSGYLEHWTSDLSFAKSEGDQPVVNVSWFAARKYCEWSGRRLLTTAEWEYASQAQSPKNLDLILEWYGQAGGLRSVREGKVNGFGLRGMHGLIWEWVDDFSSAIVMGDSRSTNEAGRSLFCGGSSLKAKDPAQYATFMRFAFRSSLRANSVGRNLGFRCARSRQSIQKENL